MNQLAHEPVSWLLLERYALGELDGELRADIELRLAASSADRACLDVILEDATVLPPLPALVQRRRSRDLVWLGGAVSMAAALALSLLRPFDGVPSRREVSDGVKGGEVALSLLSERTGASPRSFQRGDRFKLLLTCPNWLSTRVSVLVFQAGQRYQPLAAVRDFPCGNQVPWPGAFALDGQDDVDVCVTWSSNTTAHDARELGDEVVCERLVGAAK